MDRKYRTLFKDTALFALSSMGSKILTILLVPLYTYTLSTSEYGTIDLINSIINLLITILTLSMSDAVLRFAFDKELDKRKVLSNGLLFVFLATAVCGMLYPVASKLSQSMGDYWLVVTILFFVTSLRECIASYVKAIEKTKLFAAQGIVSTIILLIGNIVFLVYINCGIYGYLFSLILSSAVASLLMIVCGNIFKGWKFGCDISLLKEMLKYSWPLVFSTVSWWINTSADKLMISSMISVSENGIYSVAHKIPSLLTTVTGVFSQAWLLSAVASEEKDSASEKGRFFSNIYIFYMLIGVYTCFGLIGFDKLFAKVLFVKEFYVAWRYIPFLVLASLFSAYAGFLASIFRASKKTNVMFYSTVISCIVNIALNYHLIPLVGALGAAVATMISFMIMWLNRQIVIRTIMPINLGGYKAYVIHLLLILTAVFFTCDFSFRYVFLIISMLLTALLYRLEIAKLFISLFALIKGRIKR